MIPRDFITEWRAHAPWADDAQVEQDLVISRALVDPRVSPATMAAVCVGCMANGGNPITRSAMVANLEAKRSHPLFRGDLSPLLAPGSQFDVDRAIDRVVAELVALLSEE